METEVAPAFKLLVQHILSARRSGDGVITESGLLCDRVWVQGTVRSRLGASITLDDGTAGGSPITVLAPSGKLGVDASAAPGDYLLVIGKLVAKEANRRLWHIKAHKLINLTSSDPEGAGQRMVHWSAEVTELHRRGAGKQPVSLCGMQMRPRRLAALPLAVALALLLAAAPAAASAGDAAPAFQHCLRECKATGCAPAAPGRRETLDRQQQWCSRLCNAGGVSSSDAGAGVSAALRLWRWSCAPDCAYRCMWRQEESRPPGAAAVKYYGKWPFRRWGGMQEPASVLLSLANLAVHAACLVRYLCRLGHLRRQQAGRSGAKAHAPAAAGSGGPAGAVNQPAGALPAAAAAPASPRAPPYPAAWSRALVAASLLSCNSWLWSAVFHGRDTWLTERLDYMSADASIFFNLFMTLARTTGLGARPGARATAARAALGAAIALALARHVHHMLFVLFDYGLNVQMCIAAGLVQSLAWVAWALAAAPRAHRGQRPLLAFILSVNSFMLLEVLDFPPLWEVLDAHALWHLATMPVALLWYQFAIADLEDWCLPHHCSGVEKGAAAAANGPKAE
eukprot:scaffold7.g3462.t1